MKASNLFVSMIVSAVVAAGVVYGMNHYEIGIGAVGNAAKPSLSDVPDLVGLRQDQARALVEERGLVLVMDQEQPDSRVEPGRICRQEPLQGSRLPRGDRVRATVARAAETAPVPALVGRSASRAKEMLTQAGLVPGELRHTANDERDEGIVLQQSPAAGVSVARGSKIDLVVNHLE